MSETSNSEYKQHISIDERNKWDKCVVDLATHIGSSGIEHHALADGIVAGFSQANFSAEEKAKLLGIEDNATNYHHPATHPASMITGLHSVALSGNYHELKGIPTEFHAGSGNCETINGIRITLGPNAPSNPKSLKDVWIDTSARLIKYYQGNAWVACRAVFG